MHLRMRFPVRYTLYTPDVAYRVGYVDIRCIHMACLTEGMRALATVSAISAEELKEMCAVCYWYTQPTLPAARTLYIYPDLS
jgi:hypothetical protein